MSIISIARTRNPQGRAAFTLLEILLAIAILAIMVVLISGILGQVNGMWAQSQGQNQQQQTGRALLNFLARDINKAMLPIQVDNQNSLDFVINPSSLGSSTYGNRDNIFFQAPVATNGSSGEVAEVGYFVQWQGTTAQLCRFFVNPTDTTNYQIYNNPTSWLTTTYLGNVASGTSGASYQGLLAENVIGLWINAYDKLGVSVCASGSSYDSRNPPSSNSTLITPNTPNLPAMVEVSILVLTPAAAKRVTAGVVTVTSLQQIVQNSSYSNAAQCLANLPAVLKSGANCFTTRVQLDNSQ